MQGDLLAAHALEVRNVFVVMGDPTAIGDYPNAMDNYDLVPSGLIKLIKQGFNTGVDHSGANIGQPTSFFVGCALNLNPPETRRRNQNAAPQAARRGRFHPDPTDLRCRHAPRHFLKRYTDEFGPLPIPLLVGFLPLASARHAAFLAHEVPGITIPEEIRTRMENSGENGARTGIEIAIELIQQIKPDVQGIYLMPAFNRFDYIAEIIEAIKKPQ